MKRTLFTASLMVLVFTCVQSNQLFKHLVFEDHFEQDGLPSQAHWQYEEGYLRNGEMQYYTVERKENCYQQNGLLHIVIQNDSALINNQIHPITSASLTTRNKFEWKYGKVEVRAQLPSCLGTWPAIWMMPAQDHYGRWPKSGEIDIMEHVGYQPQNIHFAIHSEKYNHTKDNQKRATIECPTSYSQFHVYTLEWTAESISWYVDGTKYFEVLSTEKEWEAWPFDQPFYLIINAAFGGGWGGNQGVDLQALPQTYLIDYVKIYQ